MDIALSVATCNFSSEAQAIADLSGVITVNRDELEAWSAGARLKALRQAAHEGGPKPQEQVAASGLRHVSDCPPSKGVSQRSSSGSVRSASTFSTRSNSPHTMYRYRLVYTGVQVVSVM